MFMPEMNPSVKINGTKLAKVINFPAHPRVEKLLDQRAFVKDAWKAQSQSVVALYHEVRYCICGILAHVG